MKYLKVLKKFDFLDGLCDDIFLGYGNSGFEQATQYQRVMQKKVHKPKDILIVKIHNFNAIQLIFRHYYLFTYQLVILIKFHDDRAKNVDFFINDILMGLCTFFASPFIILVCVYRYLDYFITLCRFLRGCTAPPNFENECTTHP